MKTASLTVSYTQNRYEMEDPFFREWIRVNNN